MAIFYFSTRLLSIITLVLLLSLTNMVLRFTPDEDLFIRMGYTKHHKCPKKWITILKDKDFNFHPSRTADCVRMRAITLNIIKQNK